MITNRDIIIVGLQAWDEKIGSNCKDLAVEFAKKNRVLYINYPLDVKTIYYHKDEDYVKKRLDVINKFSDDLVKIGNNIWNLNPRTKLLSISRLKYNLPFDILNRINNRKFAKQIKTAIKKLAFKDYIIFNDSDMFRSFYLKEILKPKTYVYYTRDNLISMPFWKVQGQRIEPLHMKKADIVVANSTYLQQLAAKHNPKSYYVGQGCDVSAFKPSLIKEIPEDIKLIKEQHKPIIGYVGAILKIRLDIEIINYIARVRKDWNIVLVGPEDEAFQSSELHQMDNVFFLGSKKGQELPSYINAFDVAINPQILNELTIGNYPRKIDEYLAMGKITVATKTEAMKAFEDHTYLAENNQQYVEKIELGLREDNQAKKDARMAFANEHTWENSAKEIYKHIRAFEASINLLEDEKCESPK